MGMLCDWHPDLIEFITCKLSLKSRVLPDGSVGSPYQYIQNKYKDLFPGSTIYAHGVENANLSILLSDDFMKAVKKNEKWTLRYPDTKHPAYQTDWDGDLPTWIQKHGEESLVEYYTYNARDIYMLIIECNWMSAEPGAVFLDYYRNMSNSWYYPEGRIDATNPCGEQGLPGWGVCTLSAVNLAKFYDEEGHCLKEKRFQEVTAIGIRFLDNVVEHTPYFFKENERLQKSEHRIGLGVMGLAELLILMHLRYGSEESLSFMDHLFKVMAGAAYHASVDLAEEKGAFEWCDPKKFILSGHMQLNILPAFPELKGRILKHGIRNVTVLTIAPTGSTGTMLQTSTGCEPFFMFTYWRNSRLGLAQVVEPVALRWFEKNSINPYDEHGNVRADALSVLPDYYVGAMDLTPEEHIKAQAVMQKWICSSISKTINAPQNHTIEDIYNMFMMAYDLGLKGFTYYRDKSRDEQVLTSDGARDNLATKSVIEGLDELDEEQLNIVREFVRSSIAGKQKDHDHDSVASNGPTTEELIILEKGCIGGKCSID